MNTWTNFNDYKPGPDGWYLVYQGENMFIRHFYDGEFISPRVEKYGEITHWMCLPAPPAEQKA